MISLLKKCPNCGTENSLEYGFCFKCGTKFDEDSSKEPKTDFEEAEAKLDEAKEEEAAEEAAEEPAAEASEESEEKAEE